MSSIAFSFCLQLSLFPYLLDKLFSSSKLRGHPLMSLTWPTSSFGSWKKLICCKGEATLPIFNVSFLAALFVFFGMFPYLNPNVEFYLDLALLIDCPGSLALSTEMADFLVLLEPLSTWKLRLLAWSTWSSTKKYLAVYSTESSLEKSLECSDLCRSSTNSSGHLFNPLDFIYFILAWF